MEGRGSSRPEFLRLKRSDREVFVQVSLRSYDVSPGAKGILAVLSDATDLKSLEAQFVQSQKMQAIGQLAGGIAHDFNNLLTAISGHCDLLLLRHDPGDGDYADLMQIRQNANRAAALVGQLLAFSRKQTLEPQSLDLRDILADLTHLLNRLVGERVSLVLEHDPNLPNIRADKRQIEQVIMNLVVNARDAMKGNGEIKITSEVVELQMPWQRDRAQVPPGHYVCVRVSDQGCGIAADKIQKIFEPFFTTKRVGEGTGLGLSTVYGIVKQSGGFVFVDSVVGQGTLFTLLFPSHQARAVTAIAKSPPLDTSAEVKTGTILLVEDEAPVRAFASRALRLRGYSVIEADCGERALYILEDPDVDVQLFVTDVVMPGKDGPTWVCEARSARPNIGVVFMSGYAESSLTETREKVPNSAFLPKPFSLIELTDIVASRLG
jgi:two-component system, cell cycle sensor histidine kinase and response regulator CckA